MPLACLGRRDAVGDQQLGHEVDHDSDQPLEGRRVGAQARDLVAGGDPDPPPPRPNPRRSGKPCPGCSPDGSRRISYVPKPPSRKRRYPAWLKGVASWPMLRPMPASDTFSPARRVRLFRNGRNQAVRIPREFELPGQDAAMRKEDERLVIEPAPPRSLLAVLRSLDPIEEDFPPIDELPHTPVAL